MVIKHSVPVLTACDAYIGIEDHKCDIQQQCYSNQVVTGGDARIAVVIALRPYSSQPSLFGELKSSFSNMCRPKRQQW